MPSPQPSSIPVNQAMRCIDGTQLTKSGICEQGECMRIRINAVRAAPDLLPMSVATQG